MRGIVAALLVFCWSTGAFAHGGTTQGVAPRQSDPAFQDVAKIVDAFHNALAKGDRQAALALLDDQVQIYEQGWVERSKAEYASHHLASDTEFSAATTRVQMERSGAMFGDLAYVASEGKVAGTFRGKAVDSITLETMVLRRAQDGWRIIHIHWSSRAVKK